MTHLAPVRPQGSAALLSRRLSLRSSLALALGLLLLFAIAMPLVLPPPARLAASQDAVADEAHHTAAIAGRLSRSLAEAVDDLNGLALLAEGSQQRKQLLAAFLDERSRYQELRLDGAGQAGQSDAGLSVGQGLPSTVPTDGPPLQLLGVASHEPLLVVRSTTGGPVIVTSRYRASYLAFPLQEPGARERWLIDPKGEIVAASGGFQALEQMTNPEVLEAAAAARASGEGSRDVVSEGVVYGWAPVAGEGPAKQLGWVVVSRRSHASLGVADVAARRELILVAVLTGLFSLLLLGWYLITTVLPLRHLSQQATRLADGDRTTQLVPRRLDEVGVIARHLERIRRELRDRPGRRTEGAPEPSARPAPNGTGATDLDTRSGDA